MSWFIDRCRLFLAALFFSFFLLMPLFFPLSKQQYMLYMVSILTLSSSLSIHISPKYLCYIQITPFFIILTVSEHILSP